MAVNRTARIVLVVLFALYCLFLVTVVILIIRNKIQKRRRQKKLVIDAGYKNLGSDVELAHVSTSENAGVQQLPTNDEGGEDLAGKPKLEFEGNPVYQLDGHDQPRAPYELQDASEQPLRTVERNRSRRLIPSVHIEFNNNPEATTVRDV